MTLVAAVGERAAAAPPPALERFDLAPLSFGTEKDRAKLRIGCYSSKEIKILCTAGPGRLQAPPRTRDLGRRDYKSFIGIFDPLESLSRHWADVSARSDRAQP
ncbi:MAG: hypothetical protein HY060_02540 [Proteobacteria bacterium]|nr:hypothetical protein [Pseudomonadota bacterium]